MYTYKNGKKVKIPTENFQSPTERVQRRRAPIRESYNPPVVEHYGSGKKKCPTWLYIVLGCVAALVAILLIVWFVRSRRKSREGYELTPASGLGANEKYGFRFY